MNIKVESVKPYNGSEKKSLQIERMFDNIAPAYDVMNFAMTLGLDRIWRRKAVKLLGKANSILDVASGTGDMAMELCRGSKPTKLIGIDLSDNMLMRARKKIAQSNYANVASFEKCDCSAMPFPNASFDAITAAFGVRNFENLLDCYREMHRVMVPGGKLCIIELSEPVNPLIIPLFKLYTRGIIPTVGRIVSSDSNAYKYLPDSIAAVPQRNDMLNIMHQAGFRNGKFYPLTFGVCTIYIAEK
ncbi:MAG: bifunctional demethylmenaquinone methyltransferase/2-methoxy-6-polyprenyl-1,4-benzoquinol methylase UbiE [Muribaculaceae bacterium]|nr:bifunctional demethylmenaquinone methyltransferase/2-methoxy-6-polyprenyl-1,4-benzoquinol methylase UbiE [Muribaculaceae bacterium]